MGWELTTSRKTMIGLGVSAVVAQGAGLVVGSPLVSALALVPMGAALYLLEKGDEKRSAVDMPIADSIPPLPGPVQAIPEPAEAVTVLRHIQPVSPEAAMSDAIAAVTESTPVATSFRTQALRIGFAEDVILNQQLFAMQAEDLGADVECFGNAEGLIDAHRALPFDILVLDVHMPGMGGVAGVATLRSFDSSTPIIAFTANAEPTLHAEMMEKGTDIILTKPLALSELSNALEYCQELNRKAA